MITVFSFSLDQVLEKQEVMFSSDLSAFSTFSAYKQQKF